MELSTKISEEKAQRIEHLKLQGFSVQQISEMQNVNEEEVRKLLNQQQQDSSPIVSHPCTVTNN